jgi:hypothetical protein
MRILVSPNATHPRLQERRALGVAFSAGAAVGRSDGGDGDSGPGAGGRRGEAAARVAGGVVSRVRAQEVDPPRSRSRPRKVRIHLPTSKPRVPFRPQFCAKLTLQAPSLRRDDELPASPSARSLLLGTEIADPEALLGTKGSPSPSVTPWCGLCEFRKKLRLDRRLRLQRSESLPTHVPEISRAPPRNRVGLTLLLFSLQGERVPRAATRGVHAYAYAAASR